MYNLLSLALGLLSWGMAAAALRKKGFRTLSCLSLLSCAGALVSQIANIKHLAYIGDWAAIQDTIGAILFAALVLTAVTGVLNLIAALRK